MFLAFTATSMAQLPVSTTAQNKNAVLEEFTGIYCTFCPDGHKRANDFAAANPGDVVLINIHAGGYANPGPGDPDFRTQWGAAIDGQTNLTGYPAGTINRREFPGLQMNSAGGTAMGRGNWATAGNTVIGESSYVNIALEGDIDYATNTLTVDVETYFTGGAPGSTVKLNVAVLQSNVEGPQTGMAANPAQVLPNGKYSHNHMLRELLTGQWGVDISTAMTTVGSHSFTWVIPNDINGVPVSLGDLEVVAFIAETNQNIITGATGPITFTLPAGVSTADLEAVKNVSSAQGYCNTSVTPEFTIKNNESFAIDSCEAIFIMNGGTPVSQWVTGVPANGTKVVTFPSQTLAAGTNNLAYSVSVANVYKYFDVTNNNNNVAADPIRTITAPVTPFPVMSDFEGMSLGDVNIPNMMLEDETGRLYAVDKSVVQGGLPVDVGGFTNSAVSFRFDFTTIAPGTVSSLVSEKIQMYGAPGAEIQFDVAYAIRGTITGDKLAAYISSDCGVTWVKIYEEMGGSGLETGTATGAQNRFYPQAVSDWKSVSAFIPDANGIAEMLIKIEGTSAGGNALYFDNLMVDGKPISIGEISTIESSVYPNPASDVFFVEMAETMDFTVEIYNTVGQVVRTLDYSNTQKAEINTADLAKGVYTININSDKGSSTQKLTIFK